MPVTTKPSPESAWARYAFAVLVCGVVFGLRFEVKQRTGFEIFLPLCGLAAVISCVWLAGFGPALTATALTTAWYVYAAPFTGSQQPGAWIHYLSVRGLKLLSCAFMAGSFGSRKIARQRAKTGSSILSKLRAKASG